MKNFFYILIFICFNNLVAMEKSGLLQAYKNWVYVRTIRHFTKLQTYNSETKSLGQCRYISLKELHDALDWQIKKHVFINYMVPPAIGIASVATLAFIAHKNRN